MLVSKKWLLEFVPTTLSTDAIAEKLTALGLEIEGVHPAAPAFDHIVVGKVTALDAHPDADKLRVATVDVGAKEALTIVCGAPNVAVDGVYPVATIGATLPNGLKIKKTKLRGVPSHGMLCSASELGLAEKSSGLMPLSESLPVGSDVRQALDLDDEIFEIGLTPNRGDCFSVLGIARDFAASLNETVTVPDLPIAVNTDEMGSEQSHEVNVLDSQACPKYIAQTIAGIDNTKTSPDWLVERLRRAGLRSKSPVVDIVNYVMIEMGVPMHAFDKEKISGAIVVRQAQSAETLALLDGKKVDLAPDMLVIADQDKAIALAGIMGGANSEVSPQSKDIVIESAWFAPQAITGRARRLGLHTDASKRFERGVDFQAQEAALERVVSLILAICGGTAQQPNKQIEPNHLPNRLPISLDKKRVDQLLGTRFPKKQITEIFTALGMQVTEDKGIYQVLPPSYRFDLVIEEDLIEELARVWGYDNIPIADIAMTNNANELTEKRHQFNRVNECLVHLGYSEVISYSFVDKTWAEHMSDANGSIALKNPISSEMDVMRTGLLPSLLKLVVYNQNRQQQDLRLYEWGSTYRYDEQKQITQSRKLAGVATGAVHPLQWGYQSRWLDFFDCKGDVEILLSTMGIASNDLRFERSQSPWLHPGQSADIYYQETYIGFVGALHPACQKQFDLTNRVFTFEIATEALVDKAAPIAKPLSKYPEIRRDIAIVVAQGYDCRDIITAIESVSPELVARVTLFDVYIGKNIPKNTKSMAIAIYLQDTEKTLTDKQADDVVNQITEKLSQDFNATLRG